MSVSVTISFKKNPLTALKNLKSAVQRSIGAKAMRYAMKPVNKTLKSAIKGTVKKSKRRPKTLLKKIRRAISKLRERKPLVKRRTGFLEKSIGTITKRYKGATLGMSGPRRKFIKTDGVWGPRSKKAGQIRRVIPANYAHLAGPGRKERFRKPAMSRAKRPWRRDNVRETSRLIREALRRG